MWSLRQIQALLLLSTLVVSTPLPAEFAPSADVVSHSIKTEHHLVGGSNPPPSRLVQRYDVASEPSAPVDRTVLEDAQFLESQAMALEAALASIERLAVVVPAAPVAPSSYSAVIAFGASYTGE